MSLSPAQKTTLKAAILADGSLSAFVAIADWPAIAINLNTLTSAPAWIVWKSNVTITETGKAFNGTEWAGMTSANHTRLQTVAQFSDAGYDPSKADIRNMFNDIWSGAGGTLTRAALLALWKRTALKIEKILSTGTGSDASPATLGYEGTIEAEDVRLTMTT